MGPTGQVGWPARAANRPHLLPTGCLGPPLVCLNAGACLILTGFGVVLGLHLVQLSLNHRSDILCDFMSGQSVLATCILAQKHNLHFLEEKCGLGTLLDKDACKKYKLL